MVVALQEFLPLFLSSPCLRYSLPPLPCAHASSPPSSCSPCTQTTAPPSRARRRSPVSTSSTLPDVPLSGQAQARNAPATRTHPSTTPLRPAHSRLSGPPLQSFQMTLTHSTSTRAYSHRYPTFNQTVSSRSPSRVTGQASRTPPTTPTAGGPMTNAPPQSTMACPPILLSSRRCACPWSLLSLLTPF